jgi:ABC-type branched-subunit amino acid transport system ATPase component
VVFGKILEINHQLGIPILLVEQNVRRALALAQRVYILARGRNRLEAVKDQFTQDQCGDIFLEAGSLPEEVKEGMMP